MKEAIKIAWIAASAPYASEHDESSSWCVGEHCGYFKETLPSLHPQLVFGHFRSNCLLRGGTGASSCSRWNEVLVTTPWSPTIVAKAVYGANESQMEEEQMT